MKCKTKKPMKANKSTKPAGGAYVQRSGNNVKKGK